MWGSVLVWGAALAAMFDVAAMCVQLQRLVLTSYAKAQSCCWHDFTMYARKYSCARKYIRLGFIIGFMAGCLTINFCAYGAGVPARLHPPHSAHVQMRVWRTRAC